MEDKKQKWVMCSVCKKCKNKKKCGWSFSVPIESFHCKRFDENKKGK